MPARGAGRSLTNLQPKTMKSEILREWPFPGPIFPKFKRCSANEFFESILDTAKKLQDATPEELEFSRDYLIEADRALATAWDDIEALR